MGFPLLLEGGFLFLEAPAHTRLTLFLPGSNP
ncbi:hypothetical protein Mgrana_01980 [Meiothermus granaticius NBRC 107808]|uniref:Uncharacterized protein n=1 Tax=Meiothermus granaticius NBRC 107808 TaxID=1227551 RepID=A0A399F7P1_9DEIN|nr:hypothetical protein Mgrana_01980 [Meiothermus granaticius NBRC 107808]